MELDLRSTETWVPRGRRAKARPRPERLGVYAVGELLGEGGMARVYRGENTLVDRPVAIKRLLPELAHHPEAHALFLREARTAGAIRHEHLLEIYDFGYDCEGRPYFVMELAEGETLAARLDAGPLVTSQALDVAIAVTEAVIAVHHAGFLHRDIKAENVILARGDRRLVAKLIDFGIACRVDDPKDPSAHIAGTPRLMAPEQVARERADARTDVWGIGVLLYEMLAARLPFDHTLGIVTEAPHPLPAELDPEIVAIVLACLEKDPDDRPASAAALAELLRDAQAGYLERRGLTSRVAR
jgi:serine/threonine-protein kinase